MLIFLVCCTNQKGLVDMGKSLNGKELGKGISQREDGLYVARFTNRFGKRQVIYDKTYNGIQKKKREAQYADERAIKPVKRIAGIIRKRLMPDIINVYKMIWDGES